MISIGVSIDVPDLATGVRFYCNAFGFTKTAEPMPGLAVLQAGGVHICILEKKSATNPAPSTSDTRRYERHWTPAHLDLHVDDLNSALDRAIAAGAAKEQVFQDAEHGAAAFCADPFGHGFCIQRRSAG